MQKNTPLHQRILEMWHLSHTVLTNDYNQQESVDRIGTLKRGQSVDTSGVT